MAIVSSMALYHGDGVVAQAESVLLEKEPSLAKAEAAYIFLMLEEGTDSQEVYWVIFLSTAYHQAFLDELRRLMRLAGRYEGVGVEIVHYLRCPQYWQAMQESDDFYVHIQFNGGAADR